MHKMGIAHRDLKLENILLAETNPCPVSYQPLFVSKWIDYSNRHGFGFQLSDGYVGILFNDCSRIGYSDGQRCVFGLP